MESASRWCRPCRAGAWSERTACTADRDVLPRRRQMEKRCTSSLSPGGRDATGSVTNDERERERPPHSLSPGGRDAAGSVTNGERERPPQPCVRYFEERQTRQASSIVYSERTTFFSIKIVLYSVYVPLSAITLFKKITRQRVKSNFVSCTRGTRPP